ncbi:MAG: phosphoheptose isomerase [Bacteroidetes bacterium]|nr:phosphoheptose isomerase [Bacteroidota bacterium]
MDLLEKFDENGNKVSPELPKTVINYLIDIDGTICEDIPNEQPERMLTAREFEGVREKINKFYDDGHVVTFFTSRTEAHRTNTEIWLREHRFKYHGIWFGKPRGGNYIIIDDKLISAETKIKVD